MCRIAVKIDLHMGLKDIVQGGSAILHQISRVPSEHIPRYYSVQDSVNNGTRHGYEMDLLQASMTQKPNLWQDGVEDQARGCLVGGQRG